MVLSPFYIHCIFVTCDNYMCFIKLQDSNSVSVCAAVIRYTLQDEPRTGVCTTFIQDRLDVDQYCCPVFISQNPDFRLPASGDVHVIMIGPGTGIAPFRAFLQERGMMYICVQYFFNRGSINFIT